MIEERRREADRLARKVGHVTGFRVASWRLIPDGIDFEDEDGEFVEVNLDHLDLMALGDPLRNLCGVWGCHRSVVVGARVCSEHWK